MMSAHGPNPIFFNRKNKDWTSRTPANTHPPLPPLHPPSSPTSPNSYTPYVPLHLIFALPPPPPLKVKHQMCITPCHFFVIFSSTEHKPFFMHNKYLLKFLLAFDLVSFFLLCLKCSVAETQVFCFLEGKNA